MAVISNILIISTPYYFPGFKRLFGVGGYSRVKFGYAEQPSPDELTQTFIIGKDFIGDDSACFILADKIFHGAGFNKILKEPVHIVDEEKKAICGLLA